MSFLLRTGSAKGMALIAVLWITSLLALLAAGVGASGRTVSRLAFNSLENARARLAADAGVQQAIYDLLVNVERRRWRSDGVLRGDGVLEQASVQFQVRDEDGKVDLNAAPPELLLGLFRAAGFDDERAESLAAAVLDYRDDDSDVTPSGAEDPDYQAAGLPHGAADRSFRNLIELGDVLGVSDAVYDRVAPHLTIYSDAEGVDIFRASKTVLEALPGMTPEAMETILAAADGPSDVDPLFSLPEEVTAPFEDYVLPSRELIFEIQAVGRSEGGGQFVRKAVVALDGGRRALPFTIYDWRRGYL